MSIANSLNGEEKFSALPGIGPRKAKRLIAAFSHSFIPSRTAKKTPVSHQSNLLSDMGNGDVDFMELSDEEIDDKIILEEP